ncbi:hypothetical protein Pint_03558 [Pistacia integerrima]|uniref:Uncharacterized protein n=1 Tax=Pistacia integerrima TaxID=434235 RepID=A0ACC0ZIL5_9ROSI|nr:hypothetical protein Pint_03558 [Pistacia integerrima]
MSVCFDSNAFRSGQAFMLWKRLYGNDIWAHCIDEMEGVIVWWIESVIDLLDTCGILIYCGEIVSGVKILFTLDDGLVIETVIIPCDRGRRLSVFQVRMALKRHLTTTEIVEQAGMGEPLHNVRNVIKASDITVHEQGLHFNPHKVTVSTSGHVPQLKRFLHESNCALAVSLNATTDEHTTKPEIDSSISESIQAAPSPASPVTIHSFSRWPRNLYLVMWCKASNAPVRPSSNRSTYNTRPVWPSSNRSAYKTRPIRPSRTSQSQTDLSDQLALTQVTKDFPTNHIKQDFDKPLQPSGRECLFCKRDLSFTLEANGLISQPSIPPSVAVNFAMRPLLSHSLP